MTIISQDKAYERWDTLPDSLCDAMFSESNSDFIWKTCQKENIPDQKIYDVSRISGYVLMGFMHPEDVAEELVEAIGIDSKTAATIEAALNQRIFTPLRSDIDKIYSPLSKFEVATVIDAGPKIIQEVMTPMPIAAKPPQPQTPTKPLGAVTSQTAAPGLGVNAAPLASNKNNPGTAPMPQPSSNDKGWSRQSPQTPVVTLGVITPNIPSPQPATSPTTKTATTQQATPTKMPTGGALSEFDRLDILKGKTASPPTPKPAAQATAATSAATMGPGLPRTQTQTSPAAPKIAAAPVDPAPVMLHQVSDSAPLQNGTNFRLNMGMQNQMAAKPSDVPRPVQSVVLEIGGTPAASNNIKTPHYSESATPIPPPITSTGPRQITEMIPQKPQAAPISVTPPAPASPPSPPKPPTSQPQPRQKVIVQDFLGS